MVCQKISYEQLDEFVHSHPMANHIKTTAYGRVEKKWNESVLALGFFQSETLVATAMVLVHRNLFGTHWYIPGGICVDMQDLPLVKRVYLALKEEAKKAKVIYVRVDPDVERRKHFQDGSIDESGFDNHYITESLQSWGFTHLGYNYGYSGNVQSRYTLILDIDRSMEDIYATMHASNRSFHRKNQRRGVYTVLESKEKLELLHRFAKELAQKQHFMPKSVKFFKQLLESYQESAHYFVSYVNLDIAIENIQSEINENQLLLNKLDSTVKRSKGAIKEASRTLESLEQELEVYRKYRMSHQAVVPIGAAIFTRCHKTSYDLYLYTTKTISSLRPAIDLHLFAIELMKGNGCTKYDFVGISGSTDPSDPFYGLYDFKRRFGGDFIEYLGEFDLIFNQKKRDLSVKAHKLRRRVERKLIREYYLRIKGKKHD